MALIFSIYCIFASFFYINTSSAFMREAPTAQHEIVSQACYSEEVELIGNPEAIGQKTDGWVQIRTKIDQYTGWIQQKELYERANIFPSGPALSITKSAAHVYDHTDTIYGAIITLPFNSILEYVDPEAPNKKDERWIKVLLVDGTEGYIQRGDITFNTQPISLDAMISLSQQFLNLPYTWGGRSSFGYDCSGFVQMLYRQMGICLPRDSKDQIKYSGFQPVSIQKLTPGDLLFFGLYGNAIRHVGMYIGNNQFIHSSAQELKPFLRISSLFDPEWSGAAPCRFVYRAARTLKNIK